ncbi:flagellar motor switch protein FliG [Sphaerotilus natans]|jgi:flagellar motor switch protein FliG|uniref:Flagellar motor switch protein FliG n=1 Tax=Sphaerotilus sulfidivorans TaxID=639200 RepID=A0A5C1Q139_9BURK|nr:MULTISPECIES: flagellar motor switch protein FliG [Sphaerotilus]MBP8175357.1 flagellar motor switch protein FliG [Sphaerotilus sp.]GIX53826.1 flagellar motor switch protein G [Sphaerotilus natans]MCK6403148.1 flagellar motor switch protein FliG [Sphaerotilus sulfidivorans]NZD45839.1 flagellar motor switch protein FliG [Sphaerotilus sulfidivorans]QEN01695.1 flagellar motor switch protein FliG [Sphaerotilus sulfidivorans]
MDDQGLEDAAILLISMGEEEAAEVFRHLTPKEAQKLGEKMARTKTIQRDRYERVLLRFEEQVHDAGLLELDTDEYVRRVMRRALGDDKANLLIDRIVRVNDAPGIDNLKWMDPAAVADLLRREHPQIVAVILVHLEPEQVSEVLRRFPEGHRNEVMIRLATLDGVQPAALKELSDVLSKVLAGGDRMRKANMGGVKSAAEVLNLLGTAIEASVLDYIRETDSELAQKITDSMFTFDDLMRVDDRGIQALLKEVQSESLLVALKGATDDLREKIFRNMSSRAAEMLREDLASRGPVRVAEVEAEQKEILQIARRLSDEGQLMLGGGSDGQFL